MKIGISLAAMICISSFSSFSQENWPGYEGGNLHHNSSTVDISPSKLGILWKRDFDKVIKLTNAWSYCKPDGQYGSRNLAITNGYIPIVAYDGNGTPANNSFNKMGYITILNSKTGKTVNVLNAWIADGQRHCNADASDNIRGWAVLNWDPKSNILLIMNGGDGSGMSGYLPLKNLSTYKPGMVQNGVGAYSWLNRSPMTNYELPGPGPNATAWYEVDSVYPTILQSQGTHATSASYNAISKYTGYGAGLTLNPDFVLNGLAPFAKWGAVMTGNNRIFCMGPGDEANQLGLCIWGYDIQWKNVNPHGWDSLTDFDKIVGDTAFMRKYASKTTTAYESYNEYDGYYRNKAWLIDGKGIWVAWKPSSASNAELIYCDENTSQRYDLGVCANTTGQNVWPHISLATAAGTKYIVYYANNATTHSQVAVFNASSKTLKWTYDISANYPGLPSSHTFAYNDISQMLISGKHAYVGWIELTGTEAALSLLSFDITQSSPTPVRKSIPLGFNSTSFRKSVLTDLAATNGILYALVTKSDSLEDISFFSAKSQFQSQMVIALSEPDTIAPIRPSKFFASQVSAISATLNWTPSYDKIGVQYNLYQNGKLITTTQDTSFIVFSLVKGTSYQFVLEPIDYAGNKGLRDTLTLVADNPQFLMNMQSSISIFPNPASDKIHIQSLDFIHIIYVYSVSGVIMQAYENLEEGPVSLDISQLPAGTYFIRTVSEDETNITMFVKQ